MNKCIIVGACKESLRDFTYDKDDFIIASDGGYSFLKEKGYPVHLVVGDFDSLKYVPSEDNIIKLACFNALSIPFPILLKRALRCPKAFSTTLRDFDRA